MNARRLCLAYVPATKLSHLHSLASNIALSAHELLWLVFHLMMPNCWLITIINYKCYRRLGHITIASCCYQHNHHAIRRIIHDFSLNLTLCTTLYAIYPSMLTHHCFTMSLKHSYAIKTSSTSSLAIIRCHYPDLAECAPSCIVSIMFKLEL